MIKGLERHNTEFSLNILVFLIFRSLTKTEKSLKIGLFDTTKKIKPKSFYF
jgi:hypothetical protein